MTRTYPALLAALMLPSLAACEAGGTAPGGVAGPTEAAADTEHDYTTGTVRDTHGNPVAGAKILLDNTVFYSSSISGTTGEDGRYRLKVQPGAWQAYATLRTTYNGMRFILNLHPENEDSFDDEGGVRDFTWKLEGRDPRNEYRYYGGLVKVFTDVGFYEDMEKIELTLRPSGPLIDGSEGRTLVLRSGDNYWVQLAYLEDIPIGRYMISAVLEDEGGRRPLRIASWSPKGNFVPEYQLDFIPDPNDSPGAEASIVLGY